MKASKRVSLFVVAIAVLFSIADTPRLSAASNKSGSSAEQWSVQVDKIDSGDVDLAPSFQIAIYENLLNELNKTKRFKQVLRDGDHSAGDISELLILKTTVQKYTPGSETRRAVTTISGATRLTVRSQLCTRDGHIILERTVDGNVRFMGSNLRATHNLAHNVAKAIKKTSLPEPSRSASYGAIDSDQVLVVELR